jgi:hypothetical protein
MTSELIKVQQLQKVLSMIALCQQYLDGDKKALQTGTGNRDTEKRIEFRTRVMRRLKKYYMGKCMELLVCSGTQVFTCSCKCPQDAVCKTTEPVLNVRT